MICITHSAAIAVSKTEFIKLLRAMVPNTNGSKLRSAFQICPNKIHTKSANSVGAPCVLVCSALVLCDFRVAQIA